MQIRFQGVTISHKSPDEHSKGSVLIKVVRNEVFQGVQFIKSNGETQLNKQDTKQADELSNLVGKGLEALIQTEDRNLLKKRFADIIGQEARILGAIRHSYLNVVEEVFDSPTNEKILVSQTPADPANGTPESVSFEFLA